MSIDTVAWAAVAATTWFGVYQIITMINGAPLF